MILAWLSPFKCKEVTFRLVKAYSPTYLQPIKDRVSRSHGQASQFLPVTQLLCGIDFATWAPICI